MTIMERALPYNVNIENVLIELLEYMEDREDVKDSNTGPTPNEEMRFALDIRQALFQLSQKKRPATSGQSMNFDNDPAVI